MPRIVVIGTSGSGKSTLAAELSRRLNVSHIELDALHWEPNWTEATTQVFRERVREKVSADAWVVDGNYLKAHDLVWTRADTLVWLDYSMSVTFCRVIRRTFDRYVNNEVLWAGNRERLSTQLFSRDSLLLWVITSWRQNRRQFPALLRGETFRHLRIIRDRCPRQTAQWLDSVAPPNLIATDATLCST